MRTPQYLSPTSIDMFYSNRDKFYMVYLCDDRMARSPQTDAMSVGSSFDAYVKSYLHEELFGKGHDPNFELEKLFEDQVEKHNREFAWEAGGYAFFIYKKTGALSDLLYELEQAINEPRFEIEVRGKIEGVTLLGKPDLFFMNKLGFPVILDWKVNGWVSKNKVSPKPGYLKIRSSLGDHKDHHKFCTPMLYQGMMINISNFIHDVDPNWGRQLSIYGWLCGAEIGQEFICCIDQLCGNPEHGEIRIAEHRVRSSRDYQHDLIKKIKVVQEAIDTQHIFTDLSYDDNLGHQMMLNKLVKSQGSQDDLFTEMSRSFKAWG